MSAAIRGSKSRASDVVTRLLIKPNQNFTFSTRARFDENDFAMHRLETQLTTNWNPVLPLTTSVTYGKYARQPELGYDHRREGLLTQRRSTSRRAGASAARSCSISTAT